MRTLALLLLLTAPASALAPGEGLVVHFKDGSRLEGVLASLSSDSVELEVGGARMTWRLESVSRLEARRTAVETYRELEREAGGDPAKLARLAAYARRHELHTYERRLTGEPVSEPCLDAQKPLSPPAMGFVNGSTQLPPLPPMGFVSAIPQATQPVPVAYYFPVLTAVAPPPTDADRRAFLQAQAVRREEMRHRFVHPNEAFQFRLQEAIDRRALGLPFSSPPL